MADIALKTAGRVEVVESIVQATLVAGEDVTAGAPVRINTSGKFVNGNGTTSTEAGIYGIATRTVKSGFPVTALRVGVLDGFTFSQAYNAPIYVSDTDARLGDAAGTVSKQVGFVIPATGNLISGSPHKLLHVQIA